MLNSRINFSTIFLFAFGLLALLALHFPQQSYAFEVQRIPLPQEKAKMVEKFKSLTQQKQQEVIKKYRREMPTPEAMPEELKQPTVKPLEEKTEEKPAPVLETGKLKPGEEAPPKSAPGLSSFERFVAGNLPPAISRNVRQFGYDLFVKPPSTFAPPQAAPVTSSYVIGPDDEIRISLWGKVEKEITTIVDRDGNITLPSAGVVHVAGLTFSELKDFLKKEFEKYFSDFYINVTLGRLRSIKIFLVGHARQPGSYTISGLSTLINALFSTGGPSKAGSMRAIKLLRNGKEITKLDLYDFIMKGDKSKDVKLEPGDVIFIPRIGPLVAVVGNVTVPAIYELKGKTRILDVLDMASGVAATGYLHRVQVERIVDNQFKAVIDKDLSAIKEQDNIPLHDGDIVKVFPISTQIVNAVNLKGNVLRPGMYEWRKGLKVSDIIKRDDLLPDTLHEFAKIERLTPPWNEITVIHFALDRALSGDPKEDVALEPYDTVTVYNKWQFEEKPLVRIAGAANKPGEYEYTEGMKLSNLVKLAGGLRKYAFNKAELTRIHITQTGPVTERRILDISVKPDGTLKEDITLQPDDYIFVKTIPDWMLYYKVTIRGEVRFPGIYPVKKGERLADLIERAGGFTENAYLKGTIFTRKSVQKTQQKTLSQAIDRFERDILSAAASATAAAYSEEESKILEAQRRQYQELIKRLRSVRAIGRLVLNMQPLSVLRQTSANIELEDGDEIFIPARLSTLNVMGSVYNPSTYIYDPETEIDSYIDMAGGPSENADPDKTYVIKVDGSALSPKKVRGGFFGWNKKDYRWEISSGSRTKLDPGDTIIVPEKFDRFALMRNVKDISQLLFQMAVTAGVVVNLF